MKNRYLIPFAALVLIAATGCDRQSADAARKIAALEQENRDSAVREHDLEQELEDHKLAAERDAIERERVRIEDDRAELERLQGAAAAEQDQELREREEALYNREGKLEQFQAALEEKADDFHQQTQQLSERESELAGREALSLEQLEPNEPSEPVADYGTFYDSLSPYGSWFETSDYGYVWQPVVVRDSNWRPYCRGRWVCSNRGWNWISEEPFGWATYHYGRWALLRDRGWIWVPGAQWAPSWVSWRENNSHIGWAPLPPETLAYRGHNWDSSVDVQFGIGALSYNFVEIRYFGSSLYDRCLPVSANDGCFQQTANITYIHIENLQVICGGPKYKKVSEGVGKPLPYYRLEIDQHPRPSRDSLGMRPRIKGDHLVVSAPNMDVAWNDGLKPKRIKDRLETVTVQRDGNLGREITDRYRQAREEGRQRAEAAIDELGGADQFDHRREEKLMENRRQVEVKVRKELTRDVAKNMERPQRDIPNIREPERRAQNPDPDPQVDQMPDSVVRQTNDTRPRADVVDDRRTPAIKNPPRVAQTEAVKPRSEPRPQQPVDDRRVFRTNDSVMQVETSREPQRQVDPSAQAPKDAADLKQDEQAREMQRQARQNDAEQARQALQEANNRKQDEQAQLQQARAQRDADQARAAQKEANRQQREQQELAQQREQERAQQRQQQEDQQIEMQRQQDRAQQRQQEQEQARQQQQDQVRQRQQEDNQRQQENQRQEQSRQRQQEDSRQKQEKVQKDLDDQRKRGR